MHATAPHERDAPLLAVLIPFRIEGDTRVHLKQLATDLLADPTARLLIVLGVDEDDAGATASFRQEMEGYFCNDAEGGSTQRVRDVVWHSLPAHPDTPFAAAIAWDEMAHCAWAWRSSTSGTAAPSQSPTPPASAREDGPKDERVELFVMLGEDVRLRPSSSDAQQTSAGWYELLCAAISSSHAHLAAAAEACGESPPPHGFGCFCFEDVRDTGFPSFPVVGRQHLDAFCGHMWARTFSTTRGVGEEEDAQLLGATEQHSDVVSPAGYGFINQDLDPWLFCLYQPWGAAVFVKGLYLENMVGGCGGEPRYARQHVRWQDDALRLGRQRISHHLAELALAAGRPAVAPAWLTLDVVVPTFRCDLQALDQIARLAVPHRCATQIIIIVDSPDPAARSRVMSLDALPHVRVRCNERNEGASASRNRGINESAAEWVLLLDDDVEPHEELLYRYVERLRTMPAAEAASVGGLLGCTSFPSPFNQFTRAVQLSDITYAFGVAATDSNPAWGVTANMLIRRTALRFGDEFPRTGGGEDVDFCLRSAGGFAATSAARVQHPWWSGGSRSSMGHFFNWATGDGVLQGLYPDHQFWALLNVAEAAMLGTLYLECTAAVAAALGAMCMRAALARAAAGLLATAAVLLAEMCCDVIRLCCLESARHPHIGGLGRVLAAAESSVVILALEAGRLVGHLRRGALLRHLGSRFDWHCGRHGDDVSIAYEQRRYALRSVAYVCALWWLAHCAATGAHVDGLVVSGFDAAIAACLLARCASHAAWPPGRAGGQAGRMRGASVAESSLPMHFAFVVDESYAMALAVAITSLLDHQPSRYAVQITVLDCGLTSTSMARLRKCARTRAAAPATITFVSLPDDVVATARALGRAHGCAWPVWVKLFAPQLLERLTRVVLLDCDILVRGSLRPLWTVNLGEHGFAAARDIGLPVGPEPLRGALRNSLSERAERATACSGLASAARLRSSQTVSYFNSGVMVLRPASLRADGAFERALAFAEEQGSRGVKLSFWDHDALNVALVGRWVPLPLEFNAQGLGSYARFRTRPDTAEGTPALFSQAELRALDVRARIVHFTGPAVLRPSAVLNSKFVRAHAKPWAYDPESTNLHASEWRTVLDRTPWAGARPTQADAARGALDDLRAYASRCTESTVPGVAGFCHTAFFRALAGELRLMSASVPSTQ